MIDEIEREEATLREDLYSADRKFAEYYNVCEELYNVSAKKVAYTFTIDVLWLIMTSE